MNHRHIVTIAIVAFVCILTTFLLTHFWHNIKGFFSGAANKAAGEGKEAAEKIQDKTDKQ